MDLDLVALGQAQRRVTLVVLRAIAQFGGRQAVHIDRSGIVRQVEIAVGRIDVPADGAHQFIHLCIRIRCGVELRDRHGLDLSGRSRRRVAALRLAVQRVKMGLAGHRLRRVATVIHQLAEDDDFVPHLDVGLAGLEFLVAQVQDPVAVELVFLRAVVGDIEGGVSVGTALREGALVRNAGDLALHIDIAGRVINVVGGPGEVLHGIGRAQGIVRILERTGTLRLAGRSRRRDAAARITVEGIQVGLAGHRLGRVAAVVHQLAADDHFVAHLDVGLA